MSFATATHRMRPRPGLAAACALGAVLQASAPATAGLLDDATLSGSLNFWVRDRDRAGFDAATGRDTPKATNLQHATGHATLLFESGWIDERIGLDLGLHASADASNRGAPGHEINFWNVDNPYDQRPRGPRCPDAGSPLCTVDGAAVYRAALKLRGGSAWRAQLGLFQPAAPTALGVNWSFAPAYYRGVEAAVRLGAWELGAALVDRYRAPWFRDGYAFRDSRNQAAGRVLSLGAAGHWNERAKLDAGFAALEHTPRRMLHLRVQHSHAGLDSSAALYLVRDPQLFRAVSAQAALTLRLASGPYTWRAETTYSRAPLTDRRQVGNFVYRITPQFGASQGQYPIWWNNRSDFNHDGEWAVFGALERSLGDLGRPGVRVGLSLAAGTARSGGSGADALREVAVSLFASHSFSVGPFRNASIGLHATRYTNRTRVPSWSVYTNLFQDENDLKLVLTLPFTLP